MLRGFKTFMHPKFRQSLKLLDIEPDATIKSLHITCLK